jgi:hypothetical protein
MSTALQNTTEQAIYTSEKGMLEASKLVDRLSSHGDNIKLSGGYKLVISEKQNDDALNVRRRALLVWDEELKHSPIIKAAIMDKSLNITKAMYVQCTPYS